jgi:hypothetical protein
MNTVFSKFVGVGLFFVVIFVSGFWLSHSGRPYSALFFNIHKLIALAGVVFLGWTVYQVRGTVLFDTPAIGALVVMGVCAVITIVSGGLQNVEPLLAMLTALGVIHKIFPYVTVVSGAGTLVMLAMRSTGSGG